MRGAPAGDADYEVVGNHYATRRRADPRIAAQIDSALGDARTVVNVGAGAGSYEPADRSVVAVEPSAAMRAQRPRDAAPAVDATAEHLPFDTDGFDAAMAAVSVHQWPDLGAGLGELRRVARDRVVVFTFDPEAMPGFWLDHYVPEVIATERRRFPSIGAIVSGLGGGAEVHSVPIPADCTDGFKEAWYGRPEAFLDPEVRAAQSAWALTEEAAVARGLARLEVDVASGAWDRRHGELRTASAYAGAARLVVARPG